MRLFKRSTFNRLLLAALILCLSNAGLAEQANTRLPNKNPWQYRLAAYGWLFSQKGSITTRGQTVNIDMTPANIFDNTHHLSFVGELHLEASKGPWTFLIDPSYLVASPPGRLNNTAVQTKTKLFRINVGVFRNLIYFHFPESNNWIKWQALAGANDTNTNTQTTLPGNIILSGNGNWLSPMIGTRIIFHMNHKLNAYLRTEISGTSNNFSWAAALAIAFRFTRHIAVAAGYRTLGFDGHVGNNRNQYHINMLYFGPMGGIVITW